MLGSPEVLLLRPRWHLLHYSARRRCLAGARSAAAAAPGPARALPRCRHDAAARPHAARAVLAATVPRRSLASLWRLSRLLAALCSREAVPLSRVGPNGHPAGGYGAAVGPGRSRRFLQLASLNTQARPLRGRFRSQAWRRGRRRGGAAAQQEETSLTPEQVALAHRRTPGRFIAPARQVAVSHRLTATPTVRGWWRRGPSLPCEMWLAGFMCHVRCVRGFRLVRDFSWDSYIDIM